MNIINKGVSIVGCIEELSVNFIDAGWWSVFHHSTENFIMGKFAIPMRDTMEVNFSAKFSFDMIFQLVI